MNLPCPFCGGPASIHEPNGLYYVGCAKCGISTDGWTKSAAAQKAWNKRTAWNHAAIGRQLRLERERIGISARALARKLKLSAAYVSDLELGRRAWTGEKVAIFIKEIHRCEKEVKPCTTTTISRLC